MIMRLQFIDGLFSLMSLSQYFFSYGLRFPVLRFTLVLLIGWIRS